jgi:hypothetical protein
MQDTHGQQQADGKHVVEGQWGPQLLISSCGEGLGRLRCLEVWQTATCTSITVNLEVCTVLQLVVVLSLDATAGNAPAQYLLLASTQMGRCGSMLVCLTQTQRHQQAEFVT